MMKVVFAVGMLALALPLVAGAHEVYVLSATTIAHDLALVSPNPFGAFWTNQFQFFFWGCIAAVLVSTVFFMSITHRLERLFKPALLRLKPYAPLVARLTLGACLVACGWYGAFFGPELPFSAFGAWAAYVSWAFYLCGALILWGRGLVPAALLALALYTLALAHWGWYPFITYANYLGEMLLIVLLAWSAKRFEAYAFLALRAFFGLSLVGASVYAKFIHSQLALDVVSQYHLTNYFPFDPLFIVLGAGIIEFLAGFFIMVGFEVRHTSLFLLFWLILSLVYFQESVWPHLVLAGVLVALFMRGYDRFTLQGWFFGPKHEPFL